MNSNIYWQKVVEDIAASQYDTSDAMMKKIAAAYKTSLSTLNELLMDLYIRMLKDGQISSLTLYKQDRYINLYKAIQQVTEGIAAVENAAMFNGFNRIYKDTFVQTTKAMGIAFSFLPQEQVDKVINMNWMGRNFSSSIWKNKDLLNKTLTKNITNSIILGRSKDETVKILKNTMNTGFANADRLARTETMFFINQGQKDSYTAAGYTQYKFLAAIDSRTSEVCNKLNGQTFLFSNAQVGVNYPPMHARCRSTVVPVLD